MARSLSEKPDSSLCQVIHFVGVQRFGEAFVVAANNNPSNHTEHGEPPEVPVAPLFFKELPRNPSVPPPVSACAIAAD